jgi:hypothetical protein
MESFFIGLIPKLLRLLDEIQQSSVRKFSLTIGAVNMVTISLNPNKLSNLSTQELKNNVLEMIEGRDTESLAQKVSYFKDELTPYFDELSIRNPYPHPEDQIPIVLGVWTPVWSTIPFHDTLPGRIGDQSYQIFHNNGYYANIARYAPGHQSPLIQKFSLFQLTYDFMVMQKFEVREGQWCIQNVRIDQAFRRRSNPLSIDDADAWFTEVFQSKLSAQNAVIPEPLKLEKLDRNTIKKYESTYLASPLLEHIYVDHDFRLVRTQRDAKQRSSYTIAVRRR